MIQLMFLLNIASAALGAVGWIFWEWSAWSLWVGGVNTGIALGLLPFFFRTETAA